MHLSRVLPFLGVPEGVHPGERAQRQEERPPAGQCVVPEHLQLGPLVDPQLQATTHLIMINSRDAKSEEINKWIQVIYKNLWSSGEKNALPVQS